MIELKLKRMRYDKTQTLGVMNVFKDNLFVCSIATLEQDWNNNQISKSCIPKGEYIVKHWNSTSHPDSFILEGTEPRTAILIHKGNYASQSAGCVLVGLTHLDIDRDGSIDVSQSATALAKLYDICKTENIISIVIT